jgi:hypothetical protein
VSCPVGHDGLVRYWTADLDDAETQALDEHLFTCDACSDASARVLAITDGLREVLPPIALESDLARAKAQGVRTVANDLRPGEPRETWLPRDGDLLVHRLLCDLGGLERVSLQMTMLDGTPLVAFDDVPFDPSSGAVLIACRRHFITQFPSDANIVVRRTRLDGSSTVDTFTVLHRLE